jgi:hypothetical protein
MRCPGKSPILGRCHWHWLQLIEVSRGGGAWLVCLVVTGTLVEQKSIISSVLACIARSTLPRFLSRYEQWSVPASLREWLWVGDIGCIWKCWSRKYSTALRGESTQTRGQQTLLLELDLGGQPPGTAWSNMPGTISSTLMLLPIRLRQDFVSLTDGSKL